MGAPATSVWLIPGNDALLRSLWESGLPAREISEQIPGTSKSAILGRARRLKLTPRIPGTPGFIERPAKAPKPALPRPKRIGPAHYVKDTSLKARIAARADRPETDGAEIVELPPDQSDCAVRFFDMKAEHCRFPINDVTPIEAHMVCAAPRDGEHSYCCRHKKLATASWRGRYDLSDDERERRHIHGLKAYQSGRWTTSHV